MALTIDQICSLFQERGTAMYGGEAVTEAQHALQAAALAEGAGEPASVIAAALLHDLGHLIANRPEELAHTQDDVHQFVALPFLRGQFDEAVLAPIRLHVDAKRYLCAVESGYWEGLSLTSQKSLEMQGGRFSAQQAQEFIGQPFAQEAVRVRRYDDAAKDTKAVTPGWEHFRKVLERAAVR